MDTTALLQKDQTMEFERIEKILKKKKSNQETFINSYLWLQKQYSLLFLFKEVKFHELPVQIQLNTKLVIK